MLNIKITGDDVSITDSIREYAEKRFSKFDRFEKDKTPHEIEIAIRKSTDFVRDNTYNVEAKFLHGTKVSFVSADHSDVMAAMDLAQTELMQEVTRDKDRKQTLFHRGGRKLKKLLRMGSGKDK